MECNLNSLISNRRLMQPVQEFVDQVVDNVEKVIVGKRPVIELLMVALMCE